MATVTVFGGETRQSQIQLSSNALARHNVTADDVVRAARDATGIRAAGFIETPSQRIVMETRGQALTAAELGDSMVSRADGTTLPIRDVATVIEGAEPKFGDALIQGKPGVLVTMLSQYGANTIDTTRAVEAALASMEPAFASLGLRLYPRLHRPATVVENAIGHLGRSLALGSILVVVVLLVFMGDLRSALISLTAIPLSLLVALLVLDRFGATVNTMTLGGLAMALGEVVDDAIIDVENIVRRLRGNREAGSPRSAFRVVLAASLEVRQSVVFATLVVALVFPAGDRDGRAPGRLFAPLGIAYVLATLASLCVALTITPALALTFLPRAPRSGAARGSSTRCAPATRESSAGPTRAPSAYS